MHSLSLSLSLSLRFADLSFYPPQSGYTKAVGGHDGVGVVFKVAPGCKSLAENDWVIPLRQVLQQLLLVLVLVLVLVE